LTARRFKVYLPAELIKRLKYAAIEEERSLSSLVADALERYLAELRRGRQPGKGRGRDGG
jgi:metal-responsive CopG/Arc/MetJ family transcriptional regulator